MPRLVPVRERFARGGVAPVRASLASMLTALCLSLGAASAASAETVVNYTIPVPLQVATNPCFPADVVNLNGNVHVVITTTAARSGNYRVKHHLNSLLSGHSITTGTRYVNSEENNDEWFTGGPFPAVHTQTYDLNLISQSSVDDYVFHLTMHTTVTANGVPTAVVDRYRTECKG